MDVLAQCWHWSWRRERERESGKGSWQDGQREEGIQYLNSLLFYLFFVISSGKNLGFHTSKDGGGEKSFLCHMDPGVFMN